jgi:hypothetical protein
MADSKKEGLALVKDFRRLADRLEALLTGQPESDDDRWARRMLSVLAELDRRGGRVGRGEFLEIGAMFDYAPNGMGGFYQGLVALDGDETVLTDEGRARMHRLRKRYKEL